MILQTFLVAFVISYLGSIPPGMANVSVMQMAVNRHRRAAFFFSISATAVEFIYAGLTVKFQIFLEESTQMETYFRLITGIALIVVGILNMKSKSKSDDVKGREFVRGRDGFQKGIVLGLVNPMTIPFWLVITSYLRNDGLVELKDFSYWMYLIGLSAGTFALLMTVLWLGNKFTRIADNQLMVHKVPGILLIGLGIYTLVTWLV